MRGCLYMTKPLLITAGDSWTDPTLPGYVSNNITVWPEHAKSLMDWDLLNCGKSGAGNNYIANCIIDAINNNVDRDIIVFAYWTQACRLNILGVDNIVLGKKSLPGPDDFINVHNKFLAEKAIEDRIRCVSGSDKFKYVSVLETILLQSLRSIVTVDEYCKYKNVTIIHGTSLGLLQNLELVLKDSYSTNLDSINIEKYSYATYINNMKNKLEYNFFNLKESGFLKYARMFISDEDQHPNGKAHQLIASEFIHAWNRLDTEDCNLSGPDYIYE